ncbi:MAG: hypothetical protein RLZZ282_131 [Verrucomicrobiota bacterium]
MRTAKHFLALCATGRIANIPSVLCNLWLGIALAATASDRLTNGLIWGRIGVIGLAGVSLYLAGNFLNDWADRHWDARHRPERALPRALFAPGVYLLVALACGALGLGLAAALNGQCLTVALLIGGGVILYTWVHKRAAWAVIPMGLCRALLPVLGWAATTPPIGGWAPPALAACGLGLFCYIAGLSLGARHEAVDAPTSGLGGLPRVLVFGAAVLVFFAAYRLLSLPLAFCVLGLFPCGLWVGLSLAMFRTSLGRGVGHLLAGIPLLDWVVLLPLALVQGGHGWERPLPVMCLLVPPTAWLGGRFLQKLVSAT